MHTDLGIDSHVVLLLVIPVLFGRYHAIHCGLLVQQFKVSGLRGLADVREHGHIVLPGVDDSASTFLFFVSFAKCEVLRWKHFRIQSNTLKHSNSFINTA